MEIKTVEFERPSGEGASCVASAWARVPESLTLESRAQLKDKIRRLLKEKEAVLVAHYYVDADLQDLAEETAVACPILWRWRGLAAITRPGHWWSPVCASWARPRRYCLPKKRC